jgi:protein-S-isoprenylcysteine O-methyltransferase Ste14
MGGFIWRVGSPAGKAVLTALFISGWLIAFRATPVMSAAHLLFALLATGYIFTAIRFEEKNLITHFGEKYVQYKKWGPMIIPFGKKKSV